MTTTWYIIPVFKECLIVDARELNYSKTAVQLSLTRNYTSLTSHLYQINNFHKKLPKAACRQPKKKEVAVTQLPDEQWMCDLSLRPADEVQELFEVVRSVSLSCLLSSLNSCVYRTPMSWTHHHPPDSRWRCNGMDLMRAVVTPTGSNNKHSVSGKQNRVHPWSWT